MIDKDGISRPDRPDGHVLEIKNVTRCIKFDENYSFRPRNIFFKMWAAIFRAITICVFNPFMRLKYKLNTKSYNSTAVKKLKKQAFIITCNHCHVFDDLTIGTNLFTWRKIYFTTLDSNIRRPLVGFWLRSLGGIPIPVDSLSGMKKFNEDISYLLKKNKPVLYNPEGSLWPYYRDLRPFKRGAFVMAVKNDVPILPIAITFKRKLKKNGKYKYYIYYTICEPVYNDKSLPDEKSQSEKMMRETQLKTKSAIDSFYASQDCGF